MRETTPVPPVHPDRLPPVHLHRSHSHDPRAPRRARVHGPCDAWPTDSLALPLAQAPIPERTASPLVAPGEQQPPAQAVPSAWTALPFASSPRLGGKCFEDARRAINSVQPEGGWGALWVYGPLARWLAQGARGQAPLTWHVAVLISCAREGTDPLSITQAQTKVVERLRKRGFAVHLDASARANTWRVQDGLGAQAAMLLTFCSQIAPEVLPVRACEQLVYDLNSKTFAAQAGIDFGDAWRFMRMGFWRTPASVSERPTTGPEACTQLLESWRHQAAGYSPTDASDWQDSFATLLALEHLCPQNMAEDQEFAATRLTSMMQRLLAPELSLPHSLLRKQQQALAAVALTQLSATLAAILDAGGEHPVRAAMQRVLRALVPKDDVAGQKALAVTLALADDPAHTSLLRLFLRHLPHADAPLTVRRLEGLHGPMLRVGVTALQTFLYLPDVQRHDLHALNAHFAHAAPLGAAMAQGTDIGTRLAALLGCPRLATIIDATHATETHRDNTQALWAGALIQLAQYCDSSSRGDTKARLLVAAALLHPPSCTSLRMDTIAALPFEVAAEVTLGLEPGPGVSEAVCALTAAWHALPLGHAPWQAWPCDDAAGLVDRLALHGALPAALGLLGARSQLCENLSPQTLFTLITYGVDHGHPLTAALIDSMAACPNARTVLDAQTQLLCRACIQPQLAPLCGRLLAGRALTAPAVLTAWLEALGHRCATAPLLQFLADTTPDHPSFRRVTEALTEQLQLQPELPGAQEAGHAWRRLSQQAKAAGQDQVPDVMRLADLHLQLTDHDQPGILEDTVEDHDLVLELSFRLLRQARGRTEVADAVRTLRTTSELLEDVAGLFLFKLLELLPATILAPAWGDDWVSYLIATLEQPTAQVTSLSDQCTKTLVDLVRLAAGDDSLPLRAMCALFAQTATSFARAGRPELAFVMLNDAASDVRQKHLLLQQLGSMPLSAELTDAWSKVFACAAHQAPTMDALQAPEQARRTANAFWAHFIGHVAHAALLNTEVENSSLGDTSSHMARALDLIVARAHCCATHVDEQLLQALTRATAHTRSCKAAIIYFMEHAPTQPNRDGDVDGAPSHVPPPIWRAVVRSIPPDERRGQVLCKLFHFAAGVRLATTLDLLHTPLSDVQYSMAIEWAEFFLHDVLDDSASFERLLRFFMAPRKTAAQLPYRLDLIARAVSKTRGDARDTVYILATQALVETMSRRDEMPSQDRKYHDIAAFDLAYALYLMPRTAQADPQARLLGQVIEQVRVSHVGDAQLWADFVAMCGPILAKLPDGGENACTSFHRHNEADARRGSRGVTINQNAMGYILDHFNLFTARVEDADTASVGAVYDELLMAHALFMGRMQHPMLGIYLPTLTRLCGQELFNKQLTAAMLQRHLRLGAKEIAHPGYNNWLFEGLSEGAPITVAHLAVAMTLDDTLEAPEHRAQRSLRLRRLLQTTDGAMVREAAALSKQLVEIRAQLRADAADAADADALIAQAQAHLDDAWGPWWPPLIPEGGRRLA